MSHLSASPLEHINVCYRGVFIELLAKNKIKQRGRKEGGVMMGANNMLPHPRRYEDAVWR